MPVILTPTTPTVTDSMTVSEVRDFLSQFARNAANSGMYNVFDFDRAAQSICNDFITRTQCTRITGDLTVTAAALPSFAAPAAGTLTGFRPERLLRAYYPSLTAMPTSGTGLRPYLAIGDYFELYQRSLNSPTTGFPQEIAFDSFTTGMVYPTPDRSYTVRLQWIQPLTDWTAGTDDVIELATELNLPKDYLQMILRWGGVALLQGSEPQNAKFTEQCWGKYLEFVARIMSHGPGTSGRQVSYRAAPGNGFSRRELIGRGPGGAPA